MDPPFQRMVVDILLFLKKEMLNLAIKILDVFVVCSGSDPGSEDSSEGSTPAGAGCQTESHPQHEHPLRGLSSLLPGAEDAGWDVSTPPLFHVNVMSPNGPEPEADVVT